MDDCWHRRNPFDPAWPEPRPWAVAVYRTPTFVLFGGTLGELSYGWESFLGFFETPELALPHAPVGPGRWYQVVDIRTGAVVRSWRDDPPAVGPGPGAQPR